VKVSVQVTAIVYAHNGIAAEADVTVTFIVSQSVRLCQARVTVAVVPDLVQVEALGHSRANDFIFVRLSYCELLY